MALGLGCGGSAGITASHASAGISGSSSTGTSPGTVSFFSGQLAVDFRGNEHRFLSWDDGADGGISMRNL
ncbi:hypothetical protein AXF42_Ash012586 [Apostasia shenzhenica]|uniref:Uncharacterized protein n=1 Tax=Apostasia shenzhenica TaxID=1088818 RepID=A0A2H9ZT36_9ASPA|nr:hypothetical protein AXF42_Ash012586 [Apostasia shenzhenica]